MRLPFLLVLVAACSVDSGSSSSACKIGTTDICTADNVCIDNACTPAFPRAYTITGLSVTAPQMMTDGNPWNPDNQDGGPDIYVDISVNGTIVTTTAVATDTYNSTFAGPYSVMLDTSVSLDLKASNKTSSASDLIYDCSLPTVSASILRVGYVLCSGTGVTMNYTIEPS
jgi:hypothetical protein